MYKMSVNPSVFFDRRSRILSQCVRLGLPCDDIMATFTAPEDVRSPIEPLSMIEPQGSFQLSPPVSHIGSIIDEEKEDSTTQFDKDMFQVSLDVLQFALGEITIKITGENQIEVEGKHGEKRDKHGFISRHFVRRYVLPKGTNMDKVKARLSSDGVLTITAPKPEQQKVQGDSHHSD